MLVPRQGAAMSPYNRGSCYLRLSLCWKKLVSSSGVAVGPPGLSIRATDTGRGRPRRPCLRHEFRPARLGSLRVRATGVGAETTFGRVIKLVEEADRHRAEAQRLADRFATWYLPIVGLIAAMTFLVSGNALATAAVLMVASSCWFALATPVAMIASIGASARRGLLIKGGKYLESFAEADIVLIDKTGTLTLGRPGITDVVAFDDTIDGERLLALAASAERYSEYPLAEAVRAAAAERGLRLHEPEDFEAIPGPRRAGAHRRPYDYGRQPTPSTGRCPTPRRSRTRPARQDAPLRCLRGKAARCTVGNGDAAARSACGARRTTRSWRDGHRTADWRQ